MLARSSNAPPVPKYVKALPFAELSLRGPLPTAKTLRKWRSEWPQGFEIALRIPERAWVGGQGAFRSDQKQQDAQQWLFEAASAIEASHLVLRTDRRMSTGPRDREAFEAYLGQLRAKIDHPIVWSAAGLWEPSTHRRVATELQLIAGFDPVETGATNDDTLYASLIAEGLRRSFAHALLSDALCTLTRSGSATKAYVAIESPASFREAQLLQSLATEASPEDA